MKLPPPCRNQRFAASGIVGARATLKWIPNLVPTPPCSQAMVAHSKSRAWLFMNLLDQGWAVGARHVVPLLRHHQPASALIEFATDFRRIREQSRLALRFVMPFNVPHRSLRSK